MHHGVLKEYGARETFDYRSPTVIADILSSVPLASGGKPRIPFILDCIGSQSGSLAPLAKIAERGSKVGVLLPVIVKDAGEGGVRPEYSMDVGANAEWKEGVDARGVRTHFYLDVSEQTTILFSLIVLYLFSFFGRWMGALIGAKRKNG